MSGEYNLRSSLSMVNLAMPKIPPDPSKVNAQYQNNASEMIYDSIIEQVLSFQKTLNNEEEVGLRLISFGNCVYHLQGIDYQKPELLYFYCKDDSGNEAQLIQHVSQLNLLLIKVKKLDEQPTRIGF